MTLASQDQYHKDILSKLCEMDPIVLKYGLSVYN